MFSQPGTGAGSVVMGRGGGRVSGKGGGRVSKAESGLATREEEMVKPLPPVMIGVADGRVTVTAPVPAVEMFPTSSLAQA